MPTTYTDQFFTIDPYSPPPAGTAMNFTLLDLVDQNDDDDLDRFDNDSVGGFDITSSWPGDTVTVNVPGVGNITYTGTTFYLSNGTQVFTPTDGQVLQNGTLVSATGVTTQGPLDVGDLGPACFTPGTWIETDRGEVLIEDLRAGDLVATLDHGMQPVLWIGRQQVRATGDLAPVQFETGVLGNSRPLLVSPQHRMLIDDWRASYFYGYSEVFAAAKHLVNGTSVRRQYGGKVEYIHLLFAEHQVVFANGIPSESYFPAQAVSRADRDVQAELMTLFPDLPGRKLDSLQVARPEIRAGEARLLAVSDLF